MFLNSTKLEVIQFIILTRKLNSIATTIVLLLASSSIQAQTLTSNIPYAKPAHARQVLDIYAPEKAQNLPVVFWIHGGGWMAGDKSDVANKPKHFTDQGYIFVSINYRLLPTVNIEVLIRDVAKSFGWTYNNISKHGGDPNRIFVMGHSAGAQLAALICTDHRYIEAEGVPASVLQGCVPVDGDTYDLPAIIATNELRLQLHRLPPRKYGHREKFGNDSSLHIKYSAVTHIKPDKRIPPFLILFVRNHLWTSAQAQRLHHVLEDSGITSTLVGISGTDHVKLNDNLGLKGDPATQSLDRFLTELDMSAH